MTHVDLVASLGGGVLIGLGLAGILLGTGRVAGVSGVVGGLIEPHARDRDWRLWFVLGMLAGGVVIGRLLPAALDAVAARTLVPTAIAGLLVGFGTRLARGCTSGHGVYGIARGSVRSIVATSVFMATGVATVATLALFGGR